jgi:hypothetical protein
VDERQVDHPVALGRPLAEAVEVLERAAVDLGPRRLERVGRRLGAGEADDVMAGVGQFGDDGGADPTGRPGDEDAHEQTSECRGVVAIEGCQSLTSA